MQGAERKTQKYKDLQQTDARVIISSKVFLRIVTQRRPESFNVHSSRWCVAGMDHSGDGIHKSLHGPQGKRGQMCSVLTAVDFTDESLIGSWS